MFRRLYEHLTLADYDAANEHATTQIIRRFTRGNISLKNGLFMTERAMNDLSAKGGRAVARLLKKIPAHSS
ncbi:MAG: hypothetical protein WCA78_15230 [Rhizomicrobium sp.]